MKYVLYLIFVALVCSCTPSTVRVAGNYSGDPSTSLTITNNTSDMQVQVTLGSSSTVLEKSDCVQSDFGNLAQIQVSVKPSFPQVSWLENCQNNRDKCRFDEGAWFTLCESGECRRGYDQHYQLQGDSTSQQWTASTQEPSGSCSSL